MRHRVLTLTVALALAACSSSTTGFDGSVAPDGSSTPDLGVGDGDRVDLSAADASEPCGSITCGPDTFCCSWGCGSACFPSGAICTGDCPADAGVRYCGGLGLPTCTSEEFCDYPISEACGATDGSGVCTARPAGCSTTDSPVCGCDGHQYGNACLAAMAGVSVRAPGTCPDPSPCGPSGCPDGSTCQACLGAMGVEYVCIGAGAAC